MPRLTTLTSLDNPRIKSVLKLRDHSARRQTGLFIAEGHREVERALAAGLTLHEFYFSPDILQVPAEDWPNLIAGLPASAVNAGVFALTEKVFAKIAYKERPEGVLAVFDQPRWQPDSLKLGQSPLLLVAVGLAKPGNLGAMARSAAAAGASAMLVADGVVDAFNPNAVRASTGAVFTLPILGMSTPEAIAFLKLHHIHPVVALPDAPADHTATDLTGALALVVGAEDKGLDDRWRAVGTPVRIPMPGSAVDSLNASVAAAVLLFESLRQRTSKPRMNTDKPG